jgi:dTDP-L-rhamnose 4-epimerase
MSQEIFNLGAGVAHSIKEIAEVLIKSTASFVTSGITNCYRQGDIRHCVADATKLHQRFSPGQVGSFEAHVQEFIEWSHQEKAQDFSDKAQRELSQRGLV